MRDDDRPDLQHSLDGVIQQERRLARRLYRRRRPWLPTLVEVGVVAIGAAGLWAAANFDRNADAGALFSRTDRAPRQLSVRQRRPSRRSLPIPPLRQLLRTPRRTFRPRRRRRHRSPRRALTRALPRLPRFRLGLAPVAYQGSQSTMAPTTSQVNSYLKRARELVTARRYRRSAFAAVPS